MRDNNAVKKALELDGFRHSLSANNEIQVASETCTFRISFDGISGITVLSVIMTWSNS